MRNHFQKIKKELRSYSFPAGQIPYYLARSRRRKSMSVSVNANAQVTVAVPHFLVDDKITQFLREKERWIIGHIERIKKRNENMGKRSFKEGEEFLFLGKKYQFKSIATTKKKCEVVFTGQEWIIKLPEKSESIKERQERIKETLIQWYRDQAKEVLGGRIFHFSRILGVEPRNIVIRTQKRIWGSCDYRKRAIHLNWRIMLSPLNVVDYVVIHELCHLLVPN